MEMNPDTEWQMPWPPTDENAKVKSVRGSTVIEYMKKRLGDKKYQAIQKIFEPKKNEQLKRNAELMKAQETAMQEEQRKQEEQRAGVEKLEKRKRRVEELFSYAQEKIIQIITRGKPKSNWTEVETAMVDKIQTARLKDFGAAFYHLALGMF